MKNYALSLLVLIVNAIPASAQQWSTTGNNYTTGGLSLGSSSPSSEKLRVTTTGSQRAMALFGASGSGMAGILFDASNGDWAGSDYGSLLQQDNLSIELNNYGTNPIYLRTNHQTRLTVSGAGLIGIGKTNPSFALDVTRANQSVARFESTGTNAGPDVLIIDKDNASARATLQIQGNAGAIESLFVSSSGNVGIGNTNPISKLAVNGQIRATEVKVLADITVPDYVFENDYKLRTLQETKKYISVNKHLPDIPSAAEIEANGIDLGDMNMRLLKKIEELTLYQIELLERLESLETTNRKMEKRIQQLME